MVEEKPRFTGPRWLGPLAKGALDLLVPPRCLNCGREVAAGGDLCAACFKEIDFFAGALCPVCGIPFETGAVAGMVCAPCLARPPGFSRARSVFRYEDGTKGMILGLKHGDRLDAVPALARWLYRAGRELVDEADLMIPVPLHRWRLFRRQYNQSAELARRLARLSGKPFMPGLLRRVQATPSQGGLSREERRRNVRKAFGLAPGAEDRLGGRRVLLIDDVLTTGATVEACAATLRAGGAIGVDVLTLARVVRPAFGFV